MLPPVNSRLLFISTFKADLSDTKSTSKVCIYFCVCFFFVFSRFPVLSLRIVGINLCTEIFLVCQCHLPRCALFNSGRFCFATGGKQFN